MNKILFVVRPALSEILKLAELTNVYSKNDQDMYLEPGKAYVRVAFGANANGERLVELNAFTGEQVTMQINDAARNGLIDIRFASFWDKVVDEVKEWTNVDTGVEFAGASLRVNKVKKAFVDEEGSPVLSFETVKKLASFITCMLLMFTLSAQIMPVKTKAEIERDKQIAAYQKMIADPVFQAALDKGVAEAYPKAGYTKSGAFYGTATEVNIRIPTVPKAPKVSTSSRKVIGIAPLYISPYESTFIISSSGGSRKDDTPN